MSEFKREERYVVIKIKDLVEASGDTDPSTGRSEAECVLRNFLEGWDVPTRDCVVVERDWPEYEKVWRSIELRMTGQPADDFDRVTAERDALQVLLNAADERADVLEGLLRDSLLYLPSHGMGSVTFELNKRIIAALKPAEVGADSCEFCKGWGFRSNPDGADEGCGACNGTGKEPSDDQQ